MDIEALSNFKEILSGLNSISRDIRNTVSWNGEGKALTVNRVLTYFRHLDESQSIKNLNIERVQEFYYRINFSLPDSSFSYLFKFYPCEETRGFVIDVPEIQ